MDSEVSEERREHVVSAIAARYRRDMAESVVFHLEGHPGRPVWLTVPEHVHYSGEVSGTVVGVARPCGDGRPLAEVAQAVVDTGCGWVLVPVAEVSRFTVQTGG